MKVQNQDKPAFKPVTITLETQEEYDAILHLMGGLTFVVYCQVTQYAPLDQKQRSKFYGITSSLFSMMADLELQKSGIVYKGE